MLKSALLSSLLFTAFSANAQMVGTDVYLRGQYMEVGIGKMGYYGTNASTVPTGYHPKGGGGGLGFVADPVMDGWAVGSPAYMGDYFLPGSPYEAWELDVNGKRGQSYDPTGFVYSGGMSTCTGSNISYTLSGSIVSSTWQGTVDSITVTQITSFDTNSLYFNVKIILTNTSYAPKNNIYYLRALDPDNDVAWPGGSFSTTNVIEHQVKDTTVVSALGKSCSFAYMALGTTDTNATAFIFRGIYYSVFAGLDSVYNQTYGPPGTGAWYAQGTIMPGDIGIGLVIYIPHLATVDSATDSVARTTSYAKLHPANSATFNYFYAFSPAAVDSAIVASHKIDTVVPPPVSTLGIRNVNNASEVKVYPNPSKNVINITGLNSNDHISVYDMMGRPANQNWTVNSQGLNTFSMNNIATGAYIIVVQDANGDIKARVPVRKL